MCFYKIRIQKTWTSRLLFKMNTDLHYVECIQGPYLAEDARELAEELGLHAFFLK